MATKSVAARSSAYLQSIVDFVKDVKPYHTKLSVGGAISELYFFSDGINVKIDEDHRVKAFLGADLMPEIATMPGVRDRDSFGWAQERISDGVRRVWPIALVSNPQFASQACLHKFTAGVSDVNNIPGLSTGVYDVKRWDGPGITDVRKNGVHQQDTVNYTLSHGVFTFDVLNTREWIESNLNDIGSQFGGKPSALEYEDVPRRGGTITNITGETYEEFKLVCTTAPTPSILTVYSSLDNFTTPIGSVLFGGTFSLLDSSGKIRIEFTYTFAPNQVDDVALLNDTWILTPKNIIVVSNGSHPEYPLAPVETWSLIKGNPIGFVVGGEPVFTAATPRTDSPAIEVHTRSIEYTPASTWSITFRGDGTYELRSTMPGYFGDTNTPISLVEGCSYKDDNIAFTIIPTETGWNDGDTFSWTIAQSKPNYKVFGSVSGWQADAYVGRWYWNGKIGFKIPQLEYFANVYTSTISASNNGNDGSWETQVSNPQVLNSVAFNYGAFYASGDASIVAASTDGLDWDNEIHEIFQPLIGSNQIIVVVGRGGAIVTSTDGNTWLQQLSGVDATLHNSVVIPNFLSSSPLNPNDLNCVIVVGDGGTILTSVNGIGWSLQDSGTQFNLYDVTWSNDAIIAVGAGGTILRSLDRITWTPVVSNTTSVLRSIIYEPISNVFTVVGDNGTILRSTDGGLTWLNLGVFTTGSYSSITHGDGQYLVVGPSGFIASSDDGILWTRYASRPFNSVAYGVEVLNTTRPGDSTKGQLTKIVPFSTSREEIITITFTSPTNFTVVGADSGALGTGVVGTVFTDNLDTVNNRAKLHVISFLISAGTTAFQVGDQFTISIGSGKFVAVGGSANLSVQFTPLRPVSMMADPSVYTIKFISASDSATNTPGQAIVHNNLYGYGKSLLTGTPTDPITWTDDYVSFQLNSNPGVFEFSVGDIVNLYLAPTYTYPANASYDMLPYEDPPYDSGSRNTTIALYFKEQYPLYHTHGAVIFPTVSNDDDIVIDKSFFDKIRFRIVGASANFPELAAENDWIPLYFKAFDTVTGTAPNYSGDSPAAFSDLNLWIEAYTASTNQRVFSILAPRHMKTNRAASSTLTIDPAFFSAYMPFNTKYSIVVMPDQLYGQTLRVKISESLKIYDRIFLVLVDPVNVTISDDPITAFDTAATISFIDVANISFVEGGAFGYNLVDWPPTTLTDSPSFSVEEDQPDLASTSFAEGLTIVQTAVNEGDSPQADPVGTTRVTKLYNFDLANVVDSNPIGKVGLRVEALPGSPNADHYTFKLVNVPSGLANNWIAAPESDLTAAVSGPMIFTHTEIDTGTSITDTNSFDLNTATDLSGVTAPFRLWIV